MPTFHDLDALPDSLIRTIYLRPNEPGFAMRPTVARKISSPVTLDHAWFGVFGGDYVPLTKDEFATLAARGAKVLR